MSTPLKGSVLNLVITADDFNLSKTPAAEAIILVETAVGEGGHLPLAATFGANWLQSVPI